MKYRAVRIMIALLQIYYDLLKLLPAGRKIVYISRQSDEPTMDILLLKGQIAQIDPDVKQVLLAKKLERGFRHRFGYCLHLLRQVYHIATARVVILDSYCIAVSVLRHRKGLTVIQMWHAMGCLKKFAYSILGRPEGSSATMARAMNMHRNYTYALASSGRSRRFFSEAFDIDPEKVLVMNLPRADLLRSCERMNAIRERITHAYPELLNGKKNILYVPTFRKREQMDYAAFEKGVKYDSYNLIIQPHNGGSKVFINHQRVRAENGDFTGFEWLSAADYVVTDYSAIVFEAALLKKPLFFYAYDLKKYEKRRGFYIDYRKEMPGVISDDVGTILTSIENDRFDKDKIKAFAQRYVELGQGSCTQAIADLALARCRKEDRA